MPRPFPACIFLNPSGACMLPDLSSLFNEYEILRNQADGLFQHIAEKYPHCVTCNPGCSDCCHALFDLSLIEAMYINKVFNQTFRHGPERSRILEKASELDRSLTRAKRQMYRDQKNGESPQQIMERVSAMRMRCPLLNDRDECILYAARPITCRLYGVPESIGGKTHVCGYSRFEPGHDYPTVQLGKIQLRLEELSRRIGEAVNSRFEFEDVYVPLSMALLTTYDDAYLGIGKPEAD